MTISYPSTLPGPSMPGFGLSPVDPSIRTNMEVGAQRVRRRTKTRLDKVTLEWIFTDDQMGEFRTWFDDDTGVGADGGAAWFEVALAFGSGLTTVEARFTNTFKAVAAAGLRWNVTAEVEVRNA